MCRYVDYVTFSFSGPCENIHQSPIGLSVWAFLTEAATLSTGVTPEGHVFVPRSDFLTLSFFLVFKFIFIEFIGVTLVNKILQVSGVQFYNTSPVYCTVCSPPHLKSASITIYPPLPSPTSLHPLCLW